MIYLDYNATTPIDKEVFEKILPFITTNFANASSKHKAGQTVNKAITIARQQVANLINADEHEITFTSGATESINLAIRGIAESYQQKGNHIITLKTEHSAVLDTCNYLETVGFEVSYLDVQTDGLLDLNILQNAIRKDTILICVMWANNETGVIQDMQKISNLAQENHVFLFSDVTQAFGKIDINVRKIPVDLLAFSGHKIYATKGIGGLYKNHEKNIKILPLLYGGGHEKGLRSGTLNSVGIIALGEASKIAQKNMLQNQQYIQKMRDVLENELLQIPNTKINGNVEKRMYNTTNICFGDVTSDVIILALDNIAVSNGSACTAMKISPSHVLKAMGLSDIEAFASVRFSLGKYNTDIEIQKTIKKVKKIVENLRNLL